MRSFFKAFLRFNCFKTKMFPGKNKSYPSTPRSVRSNSSEKQWRSFSTTGSSGEESRTRVTGDFYYVDKVNVNGNFRKKKVFDVDSDIEFPPLGP